MLFIFIGMVKLIAWTDVKFVKRNTWHYINVNFIIIKVHEEKRKEPQIFHCRSKKGKGEASVLIPESCILLLPSSALHQVVLGCESLGVEFLLIYTVAKIHKFKNLVILLPVFFSGISLMVYEIYWAEIEIQEC